MIEIFNSKDLKDRKDLEYALDFCLEIFDNDLIPDGELLDGLHNALIRSIDRTKRGEKASLQFFLDSFLSKISSV